MLNKPSKEVGTITDLYLTREQPDWRQAGFSLGKYKELTKDPDQNRLGLQAVIDSNLEYLDTVDRLAEIKELSDQERFTDLYVLMGLAESPDEDYDEDEDEMDEDLSDIGGWLDYDKVRELVEGAKKFLSGEITSDTIRLTQALIAQTYFEAMGVVDDQEAIMEEFDPIEEASTFESAKSTLEDQERLIVKTIQAQDYFVNQVSQVLWKN